jgi:hypothetical protein
MASVAVAGDNLGLINVRTSKLRGMYGTGMTYRPDERKSPEFDPLLQVLKTVLFPNHTVF